MAQATISVFLKHTFTVSLDGTGIQGEDALLDWLADNDNFKAELVREALDSIDELDAEYEPVEGKEYEADDEEEEDAHQ